MIIFSISFRVIFIHLLPSILIVLFNSLLAKAMRYADLKRLNLAIMREAPLDENVNRRHARWNRAFLIKYWIVLIKYCPDFFIQDFSTYIFSFHSINFHVYDNFPRATELVLSCWVHLHSLRWCHNGSVHFSDLNFHKTSFLTFFVQTNQQTD